MGKSVLATLVLLALFQRFDGSADSDEIYNALLCRAGHRKAGTNVERACKYTAEHEDLIVDVVKTYNRRATVSRQHAILNRLLKEMGMVEMTRTAFNDRARVVRRQLGDSKERKSNRISALGIEELEFLDSIFVQDPKITAQAAFRALGLTPISGSRDRALPSITNVRNWLKQRRCYARFSNKESSGTGCEQTSKADAKEEEGLAKMDCFSDHPNAHPVDFQEAAEAVVNSSSFCCNENSIDFLWEELDSAQGPQEVIVGDLVGKQLCENESGVAVDEEEYQRLLDRAKARQGEHTVSAKLLRGFKYTCEHAALISDIVQARFSRKLTLTKKYEYFSRIIAEIGEADLCEMNYGTFIKYAGAEKEKLGMRTTDRRKRETSIGNDLRNLLSKMFSDNPKITLGGLMEELRSRGIDDFDHDEKKRKGIAYWLNYRTELQRKGCVLEPEKHARKRIRENKSVECI